MALRRRADLEAREAIDLARSARRGAGSLATTSLVLLAVVLLLAVSAGLNFEWDFSRGSSNLLSDQTLQVLARLDEPVRLYALYPLRKRMEREAYWNTLKRYRDASKFVEVEFVDPVQSPGRVRGLGIDPLQEDLQSGGVTLAVRGDRRLTFQGMDEEDITNAILEVGRSERRVVGLLRGYGEREPESNAGAGFARAVEALRGEYYEVIDVRLDVEIPAKIDVLVAAGPTAPIGDDGLERLHRWLAGGGRLLALLDPGEASGLDTVLERWGLRSTDDVVVDARNNINDSPEFLRIEDFVDHPAVRGFGKRLPVALAVAGAVQDFETGEGRLFHKSLASSSAFSSIVDATGSRKAGPFPVLAASWMVGRDSSQETRVLLVGDSEFSSNTYLPAQANRNLFLNAVGWLGRETELVAIRRQALEGQVIDRVPPGGVQRIRNLLLGVPAAVVLAGVLVALRRRGR